MTMNKVIFMPAGASMVRRLLARLRIVDVNFWMTYRLPLQKAVRITYPDAIAPLMYPGVIAHERHHAKQFSTWWGPWLIPLAVSVLPLPVLFSGRWFVERRAYLQDIRGGRGSVDQAVEILWSRYGYCWPKPLMKAWFEKELSNVD